MMPRIRGSSYPHKGADLYIEKCRWKDTFHAGDSGIADKPLCIAFFGRAIVHKKTCFGFAALVAMSLTGLQPDLRSGMSMP
jgi:hypothetical protein